MNSALALGFRRIRSIFAFGDDSVWHPFQPRHPVIDIYGNSTDGYTMTALRRRAPGGQWQYRQMTDAEENEYLNYWIRW